MQYAPSICHGCSAGCNISAGERYGELRRIENRYNHDVNGYFYATVGVLVMAMLAERMNLPIP